jgi:hypothetical protein
MPEPLRAAHRTLRRTSARVGSPHRRRRSSRRAPSRTPRRTSARTGSPHHSSNRSPLSKSLVRRDSLRKGGSRARGSVEESVPCASGGDAANASENRSTSCAISGVPRGVPLAEERLELGPSQAPHARRRRPPGGCEAHGSRFDEVSPAQVVELTREPLGDDGSGGRGHAQREQHDHLARPPRIRRAAEARSPPISGPATLDTPSTAPSGPCSDLARAGRRRRRSPPAC